MKGQWTKLCVLLVGLLLVAVACRGNATPPLPAPGPALTAFPAGTFTMQIDSHQWTMTYQETGKFSIVEDGVMVSTGVYGVTGDQIEWFQDSYCVQHDAERGIYTWSFDGGVLTFKTLQDRCDVRKAILHNIAWVKKP